MNHQSRNLAWGAWIKRRASFVGLKSGESLAQAIGSRRNRVVVWSALEYPPANMRKGFDLRLAAALRTDAVTLFVRFREVSPEQAPLIDPAPISFPDDGDRLRTKMHAIVELLSVEQLLDLHDSGRKLLAASAA